MTRPRKTRVGFFTQVMDRTVLPGLFGFTRQGYKLHDLLAAPLPDTLTGRRIVITGATSGLGLAAATELASMGADLVLVGRDDDRLASAATTVTASGRVTEPRLERADLALMSEVRGLAMRLLADEQPIHVLINNAGALFEHRVLTAEGYERSLAVNLMAPFLLTNLLIPRLIESAPARIVNVSSGGMYTQRIRVDDLQYENGNYAGAKAYARAKRGLVILTARWARELADDNVTVHAMHPGWADTPGVRNSLPGFYKLTRPLLRSPAEGADTIVWLAAAPRAAETTGGFWLDRTPRPVHVFPGTRSTDNEKRALWDALSRLTGWRQSESES